MGGELQIRTLGGLEISRDGRPITGFVSAKAQALLCYLAVTGRPHSRPALAGLLWGEMSEASALTNLRQALSNLRRLLPSHLTITRQSVAFNPEAPYWLDVEEFERRVAPPDLYSQAGRGSKQEQAVQRLREALELYRGNFLEGLYVRGAPDFEEWALLQQERLRALALHALHYLVDHYTTRGEYPLALHYVDRLLTLAPWQEEAHRQKMWLLAHEGQLAAALAQYEVCRRALAKELEVEPSTETTALYERIRSARFTRRHNLPPQPTPFIGREEALREIGQLLLNPDCRLLTLVGPGGIGKTRLALQAASQQSNRFLHGVRFVPLTSLPSAAFLAQAIAEALEFSFRGPEDPRTQLLSHLQEREMLLVLDGFEHILEGAGFLADILQQAPQVKLLVTSRERLQLRWEWIFEVEGMKVPEVGEGARAANNEAVQMFLQTARRIRPRFSLEEDEASVISICRLVEGMPLGIELAAGWVREFPCRVIAQEIEQNLGFLIAAAQDMPRRHRSLRAAFDYSWKLLSEEEKRVFRQLSLFRGGFRQEAARAVAGASPAVLSSLESKSLIRRETSGRYGMHELLRQYAEEKLREAPGEEEAARERLCAYYIAFLQEKDGQLDGEEIGQALRAIGEEIENVRVGWAWAVRRGKLEEIEQGVDALLRFYEARGWFQEGRETCREAIERLRQLPAGNRRRERVLSRILTYQGLFAYYLGLVQEAQERLEESLVISRRLGARKEMAYALNNLGILAAMRGDYQEEKRLFRESLSLYRAIGERRQVATLLNNLAIAERLGGAYEEARKLTLESLAICRETGYRRGLARALQHLGNIAYCTKEYEEAKRFYEESLLIFSEIGDRAGMALALGNLGIANYELGEYVEAEAQLEESLALRREIGDRLGVVIALNSLGSVALATGAHQEAKRHLKEALSLALKIQSFPMALDALMELAHLLAEKGEREKGLELAALVSHHPATEDHTREKAQEITARLAADLPPSIAAAARRRGREIEIERAAEEVLAYID